MKKYVFIAGSLAVLGALALGAWLLAATAFTALFIWLAFETRLRTRFRFVAGKGFSEIGFDLGSEALQVEMSADGKLAVFITKDGTLSLRDGGGRLCWQRPAEAGSLALLPFGEASCFVAVGDELLRLDGRGAVTARLPFSPPPFKQSYHLLLSADQRTLLLHTPWFLQFAAADLSALGPRISCEDTGHYLKHCAMSPDAGMVFFGGAKLLDEGQGTEARWACWTEKDGAWSAAWSHREEAYSNSHLRQVTLSADGGTLLVELYREGYEFRVFERNGDLRWKRAGEHPVLSPEGSLVLWHNPYDGQTLSASDGSGNRFVRPGTEAIRHRGVDGQGDCFVIEGRRLLHLGADGGLKGEAQFANDPFRFASSQDGMALLALNKNQAAFVTVRR